MTASYARPSEALVEAHAEVERLKTKLAEARAEIERLNQWVLASKTHTQACHEEVERLKAENARSGNGYATGAARKK